jgi:hypothetical protein
VGRGPWAVGRGPWAVGRGPWAVGRGTWAVGRGPWDVGCGLWVGSPPGPPLGGGSARLPPADTSGSRAPLCTLTPWGRLRLSALGNAQDTAGATNSGHPSPRPELLLQGLLLQGACQAAQGPPSFSFKKKKNHKVTTKQPRRGAAGGRNRGGGPCVRTLARQPSQSHPHGEGGEGGEL